MHDRPEPDYNALVALFERTGRHDPAAREQLRVWFDERAATMRRGRQARREVEMLAYLASDRQAQRDLGRRGRFGDLPNESGSVSGRLWIRFRRFTDAIDRGAGRSVEDFVARVNKLTRVVLLDMVRERQRRDRDGAYLRPGDDVAPPDEAAPDPRVAHEDYLTAMCQLRQMLPCRLFFIVVLHHHYKKSREEIGELLGKGAHHVGLELQQAKAILDGVAASAGVGRDSAIG